MKIQINQNQQSFYFSELKTGDVFTFGETTSAYIKIRLVKDNYDNYNCVSLVTGALLSVSNTRTVWKLKQVSTVEFEVE